MKSAEFWYAIPHTFEKFGGVRLARFREVKAESAHRKLGKCGKMTANM